MGRYLSLGGAVDESVNGSVDESVKESMDDKRQFRNGENTLHKFVTTKGLTALHKNNRAGYLFIKQWALQSFST